MRHGGRSKIKASFTAGTCLFRGDRICIKLNAFLLLNSSFSCIICHACHSLSWKTCWYGIKYYLEWMGTFGCMWCWVIKILPLGHSRFIECAFYIHLLLSSINLDVFHTLYMLPKCLCFCRWLTSSFCFISSGNKEYQSCFLPLIHCLPCIQLMDNFPGWGTNLPLILWTLSIGLEINGGFFPDACSNAHPEGHTTVVRYANPIH